MISRPTSWRRWINLAGGLLALAAVAVLVAGLFRPGPAPSPVVIAVRGPTLRPAPGPSGAADDGVVRAGAVIVDNSDPAALGAAGPRPPASVEPVARPQSLTNLSITAWLVVWLGLVAIGLLGVRRAARAGAGTRTEP